MARPRLGPGLLRLVLASMVVCSHLLSLQIGRIAVAAFFTLSGYWVSTMYARKYALAPRPAIDFYISRGLRIYPTYFVVLALTLLGLAAIGRFPPLAIGDFTVLGLASAPSSVLWPAWSLDVELQFYLIAPLLFLLIGTRPSARGAALMVAAAAMVTAAAWAIGPGGSPVKITAYALPFALGVYCALRGTRVSRAVAFASLALALAIGGIGLAVPMLHWISLKGYTPPVDRDVVAILWSGVLTPFIIWTVHLPSDRRDRALGDLAYTLYLCHWFFTTHFSELFGAIGGKVPRLAIGVATIYATTLAVYFLAERPFEHVRRRLWRGPNVAGRGDASNGRPATAARVKSV